MTTFQKVLNQLSKAQKLQEKTELTTQKVELGIIDDLNKILSPSQQLIKEFKDLEEIIGRNVKLLIEAEKDAGRLEKDFEKKRQKKFGLEREFITAKDELQKAQNSFEGNKRRQKDIGQNADKFRKKLKPVIKQAQKNVSTFDKLIAQAEKSAKDLGVKIPTASFSKMRDRLDKLIKNAKFIS